MAAGSGGVSSSQPREMIPCTDHRQAVRVLDLDPIPRRAGPIRRRQPLRHDALQPELAGVPEYNGAVLVGVIVQNDPGQSTVDQALQLRLALAERHWP